jgi:hypothetical protein
LTEGITTETYARMNTTGTVADDVFVQMAPAETCDRREQ